MDIFHLAHRCYDHLAMVAVTLLSMINGNRPKVDGVFGLVTVFLQNLSYVVLTVFALRYFAIPNELSLVVAYAIGRWSFLLDVKVREFLHNVSIIGIWREFTSWKK